VSACRRAPRMWVISPSLPFPLPAAPCSTDPLGSRRARMAMRHRRHGLCSGRRAWVRRGDRRGKVRRIRVTLPPYNARARACRTASGWSVGAEVPDVQLGAPAEPLLAPSRLPSPPHTTPITSVFAPDLSVAGGALGDFVPPAVAAKMAAGDGAPPPGRAQQVAQRRLTRGERLETGECASAVQQRY